MQGSVSSGPGTQSRGDGPGEMGSNLPTVNLGSGRIALRLAAGGGYHTCALLDDGSLKCWGINDLGQLGLGDTEQRGDAPGEMGDLLPPVDLGLGHRALAAWGGVQHTCARREDERLQCWGLNQNGMLGLGD